MTDSDKIPRTARDALIIELLGDLGVVHDLIKNLPVEIDGAVSGSIKVLADAVENAEKTASLLSNSIDAHKKTAIHDINDAVKKALNKYASETFSNIEEKVESIENKINHFELADPKSRRLNIILSCTLAVSLLLSGTAIFAVYNAAKSTIADLNMIISSQDKTSTK